MSEKCQFYLLDKMTTSTIHQRKWEHCSIVKHHPSNECWLVNLWATDNHSNLAGFIDNSNKYDLWIFGYTNLDLMKKLKDFKNEI